METSSVPTRRTTSAADLLAVEICHPAAVSSRLPVLALAATVAAGCASAPILFPVASNIATVPPDERVIIGQIRYVPADVSKVLPGFIRDSWPRFTYDFRLLQGPHEEQRSRVTKADAHGATVVVDPPRFKFDERGGVFTFRAKRQPVYLDAIMISTWRPFIGNYGFQLPVMLKLPPTNDRCVYVGTIVVEVTGGEVSAPSWPFQWKDTGTPVYATVDDDYDRDRASLSSWVEGCELVKALAEQPSEQELRALLEPVIAKQAADAARTQQEMNKARKR
jgi:hypothetical protein